MGIYNLHSPSLPTWSRSWANFLLLMLILHHLKGPSSPNYQGDHTQPQLEQTWMSRVLCKHVEGWCTCWSLPHTSIPPRKLLTASHSRPVLQGIGLTQGWLGLSQCGRCDHWERRRRPSYSRKDSQTVNCHSVWSSQVHSDWAFFLEEKRPSSFLEALERLVGRDNLVQTFPARGPRN